MCPVFDACALLRLATKILRSIPWLFFGGKRKRKGGNLFGLSPRQLRALLVVLQMAVAETEHQNATFTLIKAVVSQRVMLPEVCWGNIYTKFICIC